MARDFSEPWEYFYDHFGENQEFIELGTRADHSYLEKIIEGVAGKLLKQKVKVTDFLLTEIEEYQFFHGACFIRGRPTNVFFFADIGLGALCILMSPRTSQVMFTRFTVATIKRNRD